MPVKAGVIRAGARTTRRGAGRDLHRRSVPGSGDHYPEAPSRLGGSVRYLHAGRTHRLARPTRLDRRFSSIRRRPHLLQGREAADTEPGRYGEHLDRKSGMGTVHRLIGCSRIWRCRNWPSKARALPGVHTSLTLSITKRRVGLEHSHYYTGPNSALARLAWIKIAR